MAALAGGFLLCAAAFGAESGRVKALNITILSTMLADGNTLGEWGFAALVEADGRRLLFDAGAHTDVVLKNSRALKIDLATIPELILSHWHSDHVGGFMTLRDSARAVAPSALSRTHVGKGMFHPRPGVAPRIETNPMVLLKPQYERSGGVFVTHSAPVQLYPGVWLSGPVPRKHPERNWSGSGKMRTPAGLVDDIVPEDLSLIVDTEVGLVVLTGCGHAGVVNIVEHARAFIRPARVHALIGGIHLFNATEATLAWTAEKLREFGIDHLVGAHCTGIESVYRLRHDLGLDRARAVVGAVGAGFELGRGVRAGAIAK